jgi:hypothetical protein
VLFVSNMPIIDDVMGCADGVVDTIREGKKPVYGQIMSRCASLTRVP